MTALRQRMLEDMQIRHLAPATQRAYVEHVSRFARHFGRSPAGLGPEEIRTYQVYLTNEKHLAPSTIIIAVAALRFLYTSPPASSFAAFSCTCCPSASTVFGTTACSAIDSGKTRSLAVGSSSARRRRPRPRRSSRRTIATDTRRSLESPCGPALSVVTGTCSSASTWPGPAQTRRSPIPHDASGHRPHRVQTLARAARQESSCSTCRQTG